MTTARENTMTLDDLEQEFEYKENFITKMWRERQIDREEFEAEMEALESWYFRMSAKLEEA